MRLNRLAAAAAVVVLSTGVLSACSGDEDTTPTSGSSDSKADAQPASDDLTQETFTDAIVTAMQDAGSTHFKLTSTGSLPLTGEGDQVIGDDPSDSKMNIAMEVGGQKIEMRLVDQKVYFNMAALTSGKFAVVDLTDTSNPLVEQFGSLAGQVDLSEQIAGFGDAITAFEKGDGTEKIDGVDATPYEVTVDSKKALEAQGQEVPAGTPESVTYTFFIGPDNLVRRLAVDVMGQGIQMDFSKWGEDVSVEAPSGDEISDVDLNQLMGGMAGATG